MRFFLSLILSFFLLTARAQSLKLKLQDENGLPIAGATVELLKKDSSLLKIQVTDSSGFTVFEPVASSQHLLRISRIGFTSMQQSLSPSGEAFVLKMQQANGSMDAVTVTAKKPFVELQPGRTVVNVESSISSAGNTALEALEKMPGVTVDKDGNISLKGKNGVNVYIDGKPTYLSGSELANMLNGISASGISQVELMDQPPSRYDAAGNAGVINIRMKKNRQKGFNGSATAAYNQGVYAKSNNNLQLNYRTGNLNLFANYSNNFATNFMEVYALRTYYRADGSVISLLEQPSFTKMKNSVHNLRAGMDYSFNRKTSASITVSGINMTRQNDANNEADWMNPQKVVDSVIKTRNTADVNWRNRTVSLGLRHSFSPLSELTFDVDMLGYRIDNNQTFNNRLISTGGYEEQSKASLPSDIDIYSAKLDYTTTAKNWKIETGLKASRILTDNIADYQYLDSVWLPDYGKTNHFLYNENIQAAYMSALREGKGWKMQAGLRFEHTNYDAQQLGNALVKDSSFTRSYSSLFPSLSFTVEADSSNSFAITAGRRIDRPAFQKLNPFVVILNKYTQHRGNPYFRPQYTWNTELSHIYKNVLITSLGYSVTTDYFSQIFPVDTTGIVVYTEGNLGKLQIISASMSAQLAPARWWNLTGSIVVNRRIMEGMIDRLYKASITQYNISLNNQFRFTKGWGAELTGFYNSTARNDIQEIIDPAGQLTIGVSKTVLNGKGTVRFSVRDIFYTQWMKGNTEFQQATEYFKLTRDTRMASFSFTYRFGKMYKSNKRSGGAAGEEIQRVGNG